MFRYDVLCVGSGVTDRFLTIEKQLSSIKPGDKVLVSALEIHSGGGGTNSAAALAKLGLRVKMLVKLGEDHDGDFIEKEMKSYGVNNICLHRSKDSTNTSTLVSEKGGDRIIYAFKGSSRHLSTKDYKKSQLNAQWFYIASMLGQAYKTSVELAQYAKKNKINVLFNPSLYLAARGHRFLKPMLSATTILVMNKEEAQAILGRKIDSFEILIKELHKLGPKMVIVTYGKKTFFAGEGGHIYSMFPPVVKRVHTAGAGDSFTSGFLAGIIKGWSFEDSLRLGQVNSSSVIQHIGTKNKLLSEREAKLSMNKFKIKVSKGKL